MAFDLCQSVMESTTTSEELVASEVIAPAARFTARPSTVVQTLEKDPTIVEPYYVVDGDKVDMGLHPHRIVIGSIESSGPLKPVDLPLGMTWVRQLDDRSSVYETSATIDRSVINHYNAIHTEFFAAPVFTLKETRSEAALVNEIIVALKPGVSPEDFFNGNEKFSSYRRMMGTPDQFIATVADGYGEQALAVNNELIGHRMVSWSSPNFYQSWQQYYFPNDPRFLNDQSNIDNMGQWHLHNTGQGGGVVDADSDLPEAWDVVPGGSPDITIAVVDDGVPSNHPDILNWTNPLDSPFDGDDNDNNGWVNDRFGWDFVANDGDPGPTGANDAHGTSVAGVAAARGDNAIGVAGAAYRSRVMSVRIFNDGVATSDANIASALYYAAGRTADGLGTWDSADVVNNSWGGGGNSAAINAALTWGTTQGRQGLGATFFFASGNGGVGSISQPAVQSANIPGVVAVGASTNLGTRAGFSQYGTQLDFVTPSNGGTLAIDTTDRVGAPGYAAGDYTGTGATGFGGTSSATPLAVGISALVLARAQTLGINLTAPELRSYLRNSTDIIGGEVYSTTNGKNIEYGYGNLNAFSAVSGLGKAEISITSPTAEAVDGGTTNVGSAIVGTSVDVGFRIRNQGTLPLTISSTSLTGSAFTLVSGLEGVTLGLGEATEFVVRFSPTQSGNATGSLSINSNDTDEASFDFTIVGLGLIPSISGTVFEDWNGDGVFDAGDPTMADLPVYIDANGNNSFDQFSSTVAPGLAIPDSSSTTSTMSVSGTSGTIRDVNVRLNMTHTWDSDLSVSLVSPGGQRVLLFSGVGADGDNFTNTVLDDEAFFSIEDTFPPFSGTFRPQGLLSLFDGSSANGTWTLEISDTVAGDTGTLLDWGLDFSFEDSAITDANGGYVFLNLPVGTHNVRMAGEANWVTTSPVGGTHLIETLSTEDIVAGVDFGFGRGNRLYANVFMDEDGDGVVDPGESGADGRTLFLDANGNGVMDPPGESIFADAPNLPIVDPVAGSPIVVEDTMDVSGVGEPISDLNVRLNITHTWDSDMAAALVGPDGTAILLFDGVGGSGDNFDNTLFDDEAGIAIGSGVAPFTGSYRPEDSLSAFDGKVANGTWTIQIVDFATGDTGTLLNWELIIGTGGDTINVITGPNGNAAFDLVDGTYNVQLAGMQGFRNTVPASGQQVVIASGAPIFDTLFGTQIKPPSISGTVFEDWNGNGVFDAEDSFQEGQTVYVDANDNGSFDLGETGVATVADGIYRFHDLPNGTYRIRSVPLVGWTASGPSSGFFDVTIGSLDDAFPGRDFGYGRNDRVYGYVFHDQDSDGNAEAGEEPLVDRVLYLDTNGNGVREISNAQTFTNATPVNIPDFSGGVPGVATSTITAAGFTGTLTDVNVRVNISHAWDADMDVALIAPDGTRVRLFDDVGGSGVNFTNTVLDDEAAIPITAGFAPFTGSFQPEELLSILDGKDANGNWVLEVSDDEAPDAGVLNNWSITLETLAGEIFVLTDSTGKGWFDVAPGTHSVRLEGIPDWNYTLPSDGLRSVTASGAPIFDVRFGSLSATSATTDLSANSHTENNATGAPIGNFSTSGSGTFSYSLVSGEGDTGNGSFAVVGNQLQASDVFDFESQDAYSIRVRTTDGASITFDTIFTITVLDANDAPSEVLLMQLPVFENSSTAADVLFGELMSVDQDVVDSHTYELIAGAGDADNAKFLVVGDQIFLKQGETLDYETKPSYSVRVRTTDFAGSSAESVLVLNVENVAEIEQVVVGDGTIQRSRVEGISVEFDGPVVIEEGAFAVTKRGTGGGPVTVAFTTRVEGGKTIADLAFSGAFVFGGSLVDGNYELLVLGANIKTPAGAELDGDADGTPGGNYSFGTDPLDQFYRYFGDTNGDRVITTGEFNEFRTSFGRSAGQAGFNPIFDFDGNGNISAADFNEFRSRFGRRFNF